MNSAARLRLVRATNCDAFLARGDKHRGVLVELRRLAPQVRVERAAQALVRADHQHRRACGLRRFSINGWTKSCESLPTLSEHLVHQDRIRPARQRRQLRLAHLRRSDHLHGLRDLRRVLDRLDASADVACAGHENLKHFAIYGLGLLRPSLCGSVSPAPWVCQRHRSA